MVRKVLTFVVFLMTFSVFNCFAEKRLVAAVDEDGNRNSFTYDAQGRLISVIQDGGSSVITFDWETKGFKTIAVSVVDTDVNMSFDMKLNDAGNVIGYTASGVPYYVVAFQYDSENRCTGISTLSEEYGKEELSIQWEANDVSLCRSSSGASTETFSTSYTSNVHIQTIDNKGGIVGMLMLLYASDYDKASLFSLVTGTMGRSVEHLPVIIESIEGVRYEFEYTLDNDGYPVKVIDRTDSEIWFFSWEDYSFGGVIDLDEDSHQEVIGIYGIDGKKLHRPCKGINIIQYSDGSVKKENIR